MLSPIRFALLIVALASLGLSAPVWSQANGAGNDSAQVMEAFTDQKETQGEHRVISDEEKHRIMFYMGAPLILLLVITVGLGVGMAVFGKPYFIAHMVFAGLSVTLALAHAVVGVVWFYPF